MKNEGGRKGQQARLHSGDFSADGRRTSLLRSRGAYLAGSWISHSYVLTGISITGDLCDGAMGQITENVNKEQSI